MKNAMFAMMFTVLMFLAPRVEACTAVGCSASNPAPFSSVLSLGSVNNLFTMYITPVSHADRNTQFFADGVLVGTDTTYPFQMTTPSLVNGSHSLTAVATDPLGISATIYYAATATVNVIIDTSLTNSCAVVNGAAYCWGDGTYGQIGQGTNQTTTNTVPGLVNGMSTGVTSISVGAKFVCDVQSGGVFCWGDNTFGQLGVDPVAFPSSNVPIAVSGFSSGAVEVKCGTQHACARTTTGLLKCWGSGTSGELGNGTIVNSYIPVTPLSAGVTAIDLGFAHTCAVVNDAAKCWGSNTFGQLGNSNKGGNNRTPQQVVGLTSGVSSIVAGNYYTCAIHEGTFKCWGINEQGQLGNGVSGRGASSSSPVVATVIIGTPAYIAAGANTTCATGPGGGLKCWGSNQDGQLGINSINPPISLTALNVVGFTSVLGVSAGENSMCGIKLNHLYCWGTNHNGQVGDGSITNRLTPVQVSGF